MPSAFQRVFLGIENRNFRVQVRQIENLAHVAVEAVAGDLEENPESCTDLRAPVPTRRSPCSDSRGEGQDPVDRKPACGYLIHS